MKPTPDVLPAESAQAERLHDLVADALGLPANERLAFLTRACGDDAALLAEACSLVDYDQPSGDFLARPAYAQVAGEDLGGSEAGSLAPGTFLGEYRLLALLGEGGMGEVYLAEDTKLERHVAVKLLKRRLDDASLARRFRHERRVLAALTHLNIARLYGGGTTEEGRNYLVMEYVEGERLDKFCDSHGLDLHSRLALFRKVCAAVAHAHQNLVVHRDLKPANIRVTMEGEPKLLDFGIAKLLDPEGNTDALADPTLTMQGAMTPEYASPEQIKGEPITTATDVYSLGVVLYELLCGQRPFAHLQGRRPDELARAICEEEPPRPSTVVGRMHSAPATTKATIPPLWPSTLRRQLEGDLDNIVAKVLQKEPVRRYASVLALAEDLRRYDEGLPVRARRDTLRYRAGKFVRRNKTLVAAAALVFLALTVGMAAAISQARRANQEARSANERYEQVRQLAQSFLFEIEPQIARLPGSIPARRTVVKRALEYLDNLSQETGSRRDLRRELAAAYEKVGDVQGLPDRPNLGDYDGAAASYRKAQALWQSLVTTAPREGQFRDGLATCEERLGKALWWGGNTAAAEGILREALALRRTLVDEQPHSLEFQRKLASVLDHLGDIPNWNGDRAAARSLYDQALSILQPLAQASPQDADLGRDLARCLENVASVQKEAGDYPGATNNLARAETILVPLAQRDSGDDALQNALWFGLFSEAQVALAQKATDQALAISPRMVAAAQARTRSNPEDADAQHDLAISHETHGQAFRQAQRWPEALAEWQEALDIDTRLLAASSANTAYLQSTGLYRTSMGRVRLGLGEIARAQVDAHAARERLETAVRLDPNDAISIQELIQVYELEGDLCERQSETIQARQWFEHAQTEMNRHAAMHIDVSDQEDWNALREKLAAKTKTEVSAVSTH